MSRLTRDQAGASFTAMGLLRQRCGEFSTGLRRRAALPVICLAALSLLACVTIPIQEMSDARQALNSAGDAGAAEFAPHSLAAANRQLTRAEAALSNKDYTHAREAAAVARADARQARRLADSFALVTAKLDAARAVGAQCQAADALLQQALSRTRSSDEAEAAALLEQADSSVDSALAQRYRERATQLIDASVSQANQGSPMSLPQQSTLQAARTALHNGDAQRAYRLASNLADELGVK